MKRHSAGLVSSLFLSLGLICFACASGDTVDGGTGTGTGTGTGSAGTTGSGNSTGKAGTTGTGNTTGAAGTTGSGNTTGRAGTTGTGNTTGIAGTTGTGNVTGQAGTTGTGNVTGTGSAGTTGTAPTCGASFAVESTGFVTMPSKSGACWSGYAYTYVDKYGSTVVPSSPTPGYSACGSPCSLTMTGNILAVTGTNYSYEGLGFGLGQIAGGTANAEVAPTGTGLTIAFVNTTPASLPLRAQITDGTTTWCYTVTGASPVTIPYGSFNTLCYDTPVDGVAYAKGPINAIQLQIAGGTTAGAVGVTITSVTEN